MKNPDLLWRNLIPASELKRFIEVCRQNHIGLNAPTGSRALFSKKHLKTGMHYRVTAWVDFEQFSVLREDFPTNGRAVS